MSTSLRSIDWKKINMLTSIKCLPVEVNQVIDHFQSSAVTTGVAYKILGKGLTATITVKENSWDLGIYNESGDDEKFLVTQVLSLKTIVEILNIQVERLGVK